MDLAASGKPVYFYASIALKCRLSLAQKIEKRFETPVTVKIVQYLLNLHSLSLWGTRCYLEENCLFVRKTAEKSNLLLSSFLSGFA